MIRQRLRLPMGPARCAHQVAMGPRGSLAAGRFDGRLLLPDPDANVIDDVHQQIDVLGAEPAAEIAPPQPRSVDVWFVSPETSLRARGCVSATIKRRLLGLIPRTCESRRRQIPDDDSQIQRARPPTATTNHDPASQPVQRGITIPSALL